jgi:hypothetical protein
MDAVPKSGTTLGGRYRLTRVAWPTPIGPAWRAKDTALDRDVLVYTLAPDVASDERVRDAFVQAAAQAAQIIDPHLAQVYDCVARPPFLVAEFPAEGRLAERLADGPISLAEAARIVSGVATALRLLHERGDAHGAVGPGWVGLDEEGRAKLLGTGLPGVARLAHAVRDAPSEPSLVPSGYPEPAGGDHRTADVTGLAALALHMLTGEPPADAHNVRARSNIPPHVARTLDRVLTGAHGAGIDELSASFAPYAAPPVPYEREPGFLRTEGRWLFTALLLIAIGIGAAVAGVAFVKLKPASRAPANTAPRASASPVAVDAVTDFDPAPGNGTEHPEQTRLAADGNQTSAWFTVGYATPDFGREKPGVGLLFDLGPDAQAISAIQIRSPLAGWQAEWRVADAPRPSAGDYRAVETFTAAADGRVTIRPQPVRARFWLLWITRLTDAGSGSNFPFQAAVAEVAFFGGAAA